MRPTSNSFPFASVATSRPPSPGSKRRWPSPRGRQGEQGVRPPPFADLLGEGFKCPQRRRVDPDRNDDRRGHFRFFSTCALKPESCATHVASVSASQSFNSA